MSLSDFYQYQAQTTPHPLGMEISHAKGSYIYDKNEKYYLDFVAGVSACSLGHGHERVVNAVKAQLDSYLHVMVYGEYVQQPYPLTKTYLTNSGTEAIEGALKLAKRATGRTELIACHHAYHGNTQGSMSIMGFEERKRAFRPLLPDVDFITFNKIEDIEKITSRTAGVILETIQGGAGFILPENDYLKKVRQRCTEVGTLLILDEIQPGFGRTGKLFGFQHFGIIPDIVVMGKGMGGGMPAGAFTASEAHMDLLKDHPKLGHITTFGGHPVIAAACLATLQELTETDVIYQTLEKEKLFRKLLVHPLIQEIRGMGLMLAMMFSSAELANQLIFKCQDKGLILFWLLFEPCAVRITPPLTISEQEIIEGCQIILQSLDEIKNDKLVN